MQEASFIWQEIHPKLNQIQRKFSEIGDGATTRNKKLERVIKYFSNFVGDSSKSASCED